MSYLPGIDPAELMTLCPECGDYSETQDDVCDTCRAATCEECREIDHDAVTTREDGVRRCESCEELHQSDMEADGPFLNPKLEDDEDEDLDQETAAQAAEEAFGVDQACAG